MSVSTPKAFVADDYYCCYVCGRWKAAFVMSIDRWVEVKSDTSEDISLQSSDVTTQRPTNHAL